MGPADVEAMPIMRARTGGFHRGQPRSVSVFGGRDDWRARFLASAGPFDPVLALHEQPHDRGPITLADPRLLLTDDEDLPPAERARRERLREGGAGITSYSCDAAGDLAVFTLSGTLWVTRTEDAPRALATGAASVVDPRISPDGRRVAFHAGGGLHLVGTGDDPATQLCAPATQTQAWGLSEFIAAEEMGRYRGFWWSPDSDRLLVARVDEADVAQWWIGNPAEPAEAPRAVRYPAAGTANADVALWLVDLDGTRHEVLWDRQEYPYLAAVRWDRPAPLISVQTRDQTRVVHLRLDPGGVREVARQERVPWVDLIPGSPRLTPGGDIALVDVDPATDARRLRVGSQWVTPPHWYVRSILRCDSDGIWASATTDPRDNHLLHIDAGGSVTALTDGPGWHSALAAGTVPVVAAAVAGRWQPRFVVGPARQPYAELSNRAASPPDPPRVRFVDTAGPARVAVVLPHESGPAPVIVSSYGGPHAQRVVRAPLSFVTEQWLADCGFVVVSVDGRGSPGTSPSYEEAIAGDLAGPALADQLAGLHAADDVFPGRLDLGRVGIRGWSFGGYLAALAVLRRPDVFHAAFAGAPVTEWRLYDTHYTERYLGTPQERSEAYDSSSLLPLAAGLRRPLCLVHGLADDNVVAAHTLQLSAALVAAGRPHEVLPLPGISHMTPQDAVTENLLRLELAFFRRHLMAERGEGAAPQLEDR